VWIISSLARHPRCIRAAWLPTIYVRQRCPTLQILSDFHVGGYYPPSERSNRPTTLGGQSKPGDVAGELVESEAAIFKMMHNAFTNVAGFRLSSKPTADGQKYEVRLDADPLAGDRVDEFVKNFNMPFVLERTPQGWSFGNPFEDSGSK
jgi:hypothetical protein